MIVLDASVWISALFEDEAHHRLSNDWLTKATKGFEQLLVPTLFHAEVSGGVARRAGSRVAGEEALRDIQGNRAIDVVAVDTVLGMHAARLAAGLMLRGADAVYVALANQLGCALVTLDVEVIARASTLIDARLPS